MPDWGELQVDQLRFMARAHGDEVAYRDLGAGTSVTFSDWDTRSNRLARGLVELGLAPGDRVCILMPASECLRWIVAYAAAHKAGGVVVPGNTRLSSRELATILGHAGVSVVITCDEFRTVAESLQLDVASITHVLSDGGEGAMSADTSDLQVPVGSDDLADIMYTSGTTGLPKGVAVRHGNVAMIPNLEPAWSGAGWLHGAPLFTFAGIAFIYNPMKLGLVGCYQPKFDAEQWLDIVERERTMMAFLVPAMAELLIVHPDFATRDLSSLQVVSIGSAPLAPATLRTLQQRLPGARVSNSYGMTEAGPAFIMMPKEEVERRVGSVGKPVPPMEIRIVGDAGESGEDCDAGEVGELWTRMPGRQREYYKDEGATAATWTPDGWLRSGDLAYVDEDGFLYIVGRSKDLIIRGGHNVYPTDVEAVLLEHDDVAEAAVVGIPHPVLGEDIAAVVVLRADRNEDRDALFAFCASRLADYKRPRRIEFATELPRNATSKVMKRDLREQLLA